VQHHSCYTRLLRRQPHLPCQGRQSRAHTRDDCNRNAPAPFVGGWPEQVTCTANCTRPHRTLQHVRRVTMMSDALS
jgi:hypothetical protein